MLQPLRNNTSNFGDFNYQTPKISAAKTPSFQNSSPVYAYKGEPVYDEKMDLDDDGTITFDEFNQYCEDNNISDAEKNRLIQDRIKWQTYKQCFNYAQKGELKYDEEMDTNKDNKVSYDEYIEYLKEKDKDKEKTLQKIDNQKDQTKNITDDTSKENTLTNKINSYVQKEADEKANIEVEI